MLKKRSTRAVLLLLSCLLLPGLLFPYIAPLDTLKTARFCQYSYTAQFQLFLESEINEAEEDNTEEQLHPFFSFFIDTKWFHSFSKKQKWHCRTNYHILPQHLLTQNHLRAPPVTV